jgi:hypothetical protein
MTPDLEALQRWESAGGSWYVVGSTADAATLSLCRCDGGEEVERLVSQDPALLAYVVARPSSEAPEPSGDEL